MSSFRNSDKTSEIPKRLGRIRMRIEMPLDRFIDLYRLVSVGKLIQGLVHNLNGPLQNLGMDMEMMQHTLGSDKRLPKDLSDSFLARLQRMETEFDQVNHLIKSAAMRVELEGDFLRSGDIKSLLEQEVSFLNADLYFKHNVRKEIQISEELTHVDGLPSELLHSLCWFVQAAVEEMEKGGAKNFGLSGRSTPSGLEICLLMEGETIGGTRMQDSPVDVPSGGPLKVEDGFGMALPLALMRVHGASTTCKRGPKRIEFTLTIPCQAENRVRDSCPSP
jgi:hypothetical protein